MRSKADETLVIVETLICPLQNASYLAKDSELGAKCLNKICLKIIQNGLNGHCNMKIFKNFSEKIATGAVVVAHFVSK